MLSVTDHLKKGGPTYTYRVEVTPVEPKLALSDPEVRAVTRRSGRRSPCRAGNRFATLVNAGRVDFGGDADARSATGCRPKVTVATEHDAGEHDAGPGGVRGRRRTPRSAGTLVPIHGDARRPER